MAEIKNEQQTNKYITLKYAEFKDGNKQSERAENKREVGVREDFSEEVTVRLGLVEMGQGFHRGKILGCGLQV